MDDADRAGIEQARLENAFLAKRTTLTPSQPSATDCIDCGDEIPAKRREYVPGVQRCINCQTLKERQ